MEHAAIAAALLLAAAWLLSPAQTASHLECFTQRLQTLAIMDARGQLALDDFKYPMFSEYLFATRVGVEKLLQGVMWLSISNGNANFPVLTIVSLLGVFASTHVIVRRWAAEPGWATAAALLLLPGFVESSFYFADNLPSAALAIAGMALIGPADGGLALGGRPRAVRRRDADPPRRLPARRARRVGAWAAVALAVAVFVMPPFMFELDGPRAYLGRL